MTTYSSVWETAWNTKEEKLSRDNYDNWSIAMKKHLECKNYYGFIDGTRLPPSSIEAPSGTAYGDKLVAREHQEHFDTVIVKAGSCIFNACNAAIQERYLKSINKARPDLLWKTLKKALEGDEAELLEKFYLCYKTPTMCFAEYFYKLKEYQRRRTIS